MDQGWKQTLFYAPQTGLMADWSGMDLNEEFLESMQQKISGEGEVRSADTQILDERSAVIHIDQLMPATDSQYRFVDLYKIIQNCKLQIIHTFVRFEAPHVFLPVAAGTDIPPARNDKSIVG